MPKAKHFAAFSVEGGFFGNIKLNADKDFLYKFTYDRVYLLDLMNDSNGQLRPIEDFDEKELLEIYQSASGRDHVQLVNTIDELKALSDHPRYQALVQLALEHSTNQ